MSGALDFLSPGLAHDDNGFHPVARSALERLYRAAGATFEERDRWLVATAVPGEADRLRHVGIADLSHLGKLDVRPAPPDVDGYDDLPSLAATRARALPHRGAGEGGERAPPAVDVTAAYAVLGVTGPEARALLGRLTHLHDFPCGGEVAHVTAHVLPSGDGYRLVVAQELGLYLAEVALESAEALGGGLVGVDVLPAEERA